MSSFKRFSVLPWLVLFFILTPSLPSVAGEKRWVCNAFGTHHHHPKECSKPGDGGEWIIVGGSKGVENKPDKPLDPVNAHVLDTAKAIEGAYKPDATTSDRDSGLYNCTTYVQTVLEKAGFQVTNSMKQRINISDVTLEQLPQLIADQDPKIKGVVTALVESGQGSPVKSKSQLTPGQFVQMWRKNKNTGRYEGHTGVIDSIDGLNFSLQGAHQSLKRTHTGKVMKAGRTGIQTYSLKTWSHVWAVQPKKSR